MERSRPVIPNLNSLLEDIYVRYVKLTEFPQHYKVFDSIFNDLHKKMKDVNPYYGKYSSAVYHTGSHLDKLRIKKPDEFDMVVVIDLPVNFHLDSINPSNSDIILEAKGATSVQLKMGTQFQRLPYRDPSEWPINKEAYAWMDDRHYLLRSNFLAWFESVVTKGLNQHKARAYSPAIMYVEGVPYTVGLSKAGPAVTLQIRNNDRGFKMDIDLVPALRFPETRWPITTRHRAIPAKARQNYFLVVPKLNKNLTIEQDKERGWIFGLKHQEKQLMYDSYNLKLTIRLMKKLRDSLGMDKIASYYIKTLFLWEITNINNENYWRNDLAVLFKHMVGKLHARLESGEFPYFWNSGNNLSSSVSKSTLQQYANQLLPLMKILEDPSKYKLVAKFLLTRQEFDHYNANYLHI